MSKDLNSLSRALEQLTLDFQAEGDRCRELMTRLQELEQQLALASVSRTDQAAALAELDAKIEAAAACALLELEAQENPKRVRQSVRDFLAAPLTDEERALAKAREAAFPKGCTRLQALASQYNDLPNSTQPDSDDALMGNLLDIVDALTEEVELLKSALFEREAQA